MSITVALVVALGSACSGDELGTTSTTTTTLATLDVAPVAHDLGIEPYAPLAAFDAVWTIGNAGDPAAVRAPAVVRLDPDGSDTDPVLLGIDSRPLGPDDGSWFGGLAADDSSLYVVVDRALYRVDPATRAVDGSWALPDGVPCCLVADDRVVWILQQGTERGLVRVDTRTDEIESFAAPTGLKNLAVGADAVWVTDVDGGVVLRYDRATGAVLATISVLPRPAQISVADDGVWVTSQAAGALQRIAVETDAVVDTFELGAADDFDESVEAFALTLTDDAIVVALHRLGDDAASIVVLDRETATVRAPHEIGGGFVHEIAVLDDAMFYSEPYSELFYDPDRPPESEPTGWEPAPLLELPL